MIDIKDLSQAEKVRRIDWIQGAVIDFSNGRHLDDVWAEIVSIALPSQPDPNNDPEYPDSETTS